MTRLILICAAVLILSSCTGTPAPEPRAPAARFERVGIDPIEHGRRISTVLGCNGCHGRDLEGEDWGDPAFGTLWTSNLTRAVAGYSDAQLDETIRGGRRPDGSELWGMPSHIFTELTPEDMAAIIAYLRSVPAAGSEHPRPAFAAGGQAEIDAGLFKSSPREVALADANQPPQIEGFELGRYLVRATCAECHGLDLRGGTPHPGAAARPDLRMVLAYDAPQFERLLREGVAVGDRRVGLMTEVAIGRFSSFTPGESRAIHDYLRQVAASDASP